MDMEVDVLVIVRQGTVRAVKFAPTSETELTMTALSLVDDRLLVRIWWAEPVTGDEAYQAACLAALRAVHDLLLDTSATDPLAAPLAAALAQTLRDALGDADE